MTPGLFSPVAQSLFCSSAVACTVTVDEVVRKKGITIGLRLTVCHNLLSKSLSFTKAEVTHVALLHAVMLTIL